MDYLAVMLQGFERGVVTTAKLALVVTPVLVLLEIARDTRIMERVAARVERWTRAFSLPADAAPALVTGFIFGVTFGSGVVLQAGRDGKLNRRQLNLLCSFIGLCHAVVEETVVFTALGANGLIIFGARFVSALAVTVALASARREPGGAGAAPARTAGR